MRTRESEITANVIFWAKRGIKISRREAHEAINALPEVEGFDCYLVVPMGITTAEVWSILKKEMSASEKMIDEDFKFYALPRTNEERSYAVATRWQQEYDFVCPCYNKHSHCHTALDWEKEAMHFMTPIEYMVLAMRWHEENGTYLDESFATIFPRSRMSTGWVPEINGSGETLYFVHEPAQYRSGRSTHNSRMDGNGVREVIAEGEPSTEDIPYNHESPFRL